MLMNYLLLGAILVAFFIVISLVKKLRRRTLAHLLNPPSPSWLAGNLSDLQRPAKSVGDTDSAWLEDYGTAFKIRGPFGKELLYLADPKGLQHVLNTSGYNYPKTKASRTIFLFFTGPGIVAAEGTQHARHRKVMNPAFSYSVLKGFVPLFFRTAEKLSGKWKYLAHDTGSAVVNVSPWLSRMTLDVTGETAFDYQFDCLDESHDELAKSFTNLLDDTLSQPADITIAAQAALNYLPSWFYKVVLRIPTTPIKRLTHYLSTSRAVAQRIVDREWDAVQKGKPIGKDLMSILVRANGSEDPSRRLTDTEIYAQMTTFMAAGHETTAASITWLLYEVSQRHDVQSKIRGEIKAMRALVAARRDEEISVADLESMTYTLATLKEALRLHPVGPYIAREAIHDDVIPISIPQRTVSGDYINSIPISKGQEILISLCGYNRLKSVWGADADQWRPERFLEVNEQKVGLGVVANLATFSSGVRNCIAWRFAMLEMQAVLIELLENFEFTLPDDVEIIRVYAGAMTPMVAGQTDRGTQMPLIVTPIS